MWKDLGKFLYDNLLPLLTTKWPDYIKDNKGLGRMVRETFINEIYPLGSILLISITLVSTLFFYFYFNKRFGKYYSLKSWFSWLLFTSVIVGLATSLMSFYQLKTFNVSTTSFSIWIGVINMLFAMILFFGFSMLFQILSILIRKIFNYDLSPMGNRTPF